MSRIFEVVQAMSGQKNSITIPGPYVDFFAGDQQPHALGAILNQLVFWSGKSDLNDGWFYKEHAELASEIRGVTADQVYRLVKKIRRWLPGVIEVAQHQVNGTKKTHYRVDGDALIAKIFPPLLGFRRIAERETRSRENPFRRITKPIPQNHKTLTAKSRNLFSIQITTQILTNRSLNPSCRRILANPPTRSLRLNFWPPILTPLSTHPKAGNGVLSRTRTVLNGCLSRKRNCISASRSRRRKNPNWTDWANDIRLMRTIDGHTHREICEMYLAVTRDDFWCRNILSTSKLREKWDELTLKLIAAKNTVADTADTTEREAAYKRYFKLTLDNKSKSEIETAARREADGASVKAMRADFAKTTWNKIWAECSQRQSGEKAA